VTLFILPAISSTKHESEDPDGTNAQTSRCEVDHSPKSLIRVSFVWPGSGQVREYGYWRSASAHPTREIRPHNAGCRIRKPAIGTTTSESTASRVARAPFSNGVEERSAKYVPAVLSVANLRLPGERDSGPLWTSLTAKWQAFAGKLSSRNSPQFSDSSTHPHLLASEKAAYD
jgi:hypothetical protein